MLHFHHYSKRLSDMWCKESGENYQSYQIFRVHSSVQHCPYFVSLSIFLVENIWIESFFIKNFENYLIQKIVKTKKSLVNKNFLNFFLGQNIIDARK